MKQSYKLEDNIEYYVMEDVTYNGNKYILLSEKGNVKNIAIRKYVKVKNKEILEGLDEEEFEKVLKKFRDKFKNLFK